MRKILKKLNPGLINMIKVKERKILLLPGDGVGPEVVAEAKKVI